MQTKKIIGVALCAAMLSSVAAISVSARDVIPSDELPWVVADHTYGAIGTFNDWGGDIALTDEDGDGIYTGVIEGLAAGEYKGKVRADGAWNDSWGGFNEDKEQNYDGPDIAFTVEEGQTIEVKFDTTKEVEGYEGNDAYLMWEVTYAVKADEEEKTPALSFEKLGVVGTITEWADGADIAMTDSDGDGIYEAAVKVTAADEFKVRADGVWNVTVDEKQEPRNWGMYDDDKESTMDGANVKPGVDAEITITFDTTDEDPNNWAITYSYVKDGETVVIYTGKPEEGGSEQGGSEQGGSEQGGSEQGGSEQGGSEEGGTVQEETPAYTTQRNDYIYFDNTNTKWDKVYVYYYAPEFGPVVDFLGRSIAIEIDEATGLVKWPGKPMTQVLDEKGNPTDIWQYPTPIGAESIYFNNGWSDDAVKEYFNGLTADQQKAAKAGERAGLDCAYQTYGGGNEAGGNGLVFNAETDKGKVFSIKAEAVNNDEYITWGRAKFSLKGEYSANAVESAAYEGPFNQEVFGQKDIDDAKNEDNKTVDQDTNSGANSGSNTTGGNTSGNGTGVPATSDTAMAVAFVGVAVAALGAAVLASKKKKDEE